MALITTVPPVEEPVSASEALAVARVDSATEIPAMERLIAMSRAEVEAFLRRKLVSQTVQLRLDCLGTAIRIPCAPVISITSVQYLALDGVLTTLAADQYRWIRSEEPTRIIPASNVSWPDVLREPDSVIVTFLAGYGDAADVPPGIAGAVLHLTAHRYDFPSGDMPPSVRDLLTPHILWI